MCAFPASASVGVCGRGERSQRAHQPTHGWETRGAASSHAQNVRFKKCVHAHAMRNTGWGARSGTQTVTQAHARRRTPTPTHRSPKAVQAPKNHRHGIARHLDTPTRARIGKARRHGHTHTRPRAHGTWCQMRAFSSSISARRRRVELPPRHASHTVRNEPSRLLRITSSASNRSMGVLGTWAPRPRPSTTCVSHTRTRAPLQAPVQACARLQIVRVRVWGASVSVSVSAAERANAGVSVGAV
jgi:hypothetical protein